MTKEINAKSQVEGQNIKTCSVKNCNNKIIPGKEVKLDGKIFCPVCGTILMKEIMGL